MQEINRYIAITYRKIGWNSEKQKNEMERKQKWQVLAPANSSRNRFSTILVLHHLTIIK